MFFEKITDTSGYIFYKIFSRRPVAMVAFQKYHDNKTYQKTGNAWISFRPQRTTTIMISKVFKLAQAELK